MISRYAKDYLLDPKEVAAHVVGYSDCSRSFDDLKCRMKRDLETYTSMGKMEKEDVHVVFSAWADWAKKNLSQKRFRQ